MKHSNFFNVNTNVGGGFNEVALVANGKEEENDVDSARHGQRGDRIMNKLDFVLAYVGFGFRKSHIDYQAHDRRRE